MIRKADGFLLLLLLLCAANYFPARGEIIFSDDFEGGTLSLNSNWQSISSTRKGDVAIESRPEYVHSGSLSLRLTAAANNGEAAVGQVTRWFMPGYDQVYYRWYAKFAEDFDQGDLMHWSMIGGSLTDNMWSAFGKAGIKPMGYDFFTTSLEPWRNWGEFPPPGAMNFGTYWPEMKAAPGGMYWGNQFQPLLPFVIERGKWYCFEVMVKLNTLGVHDGEQAFWMDGVKIYHQRNIRWRDTEFLKLNFFWLSVYVHQSRKDNTCWYDDLVISTEYVGPMEGKATPWWLTCDYNRDGNFTIVDAIMLLRMKWYDPEDERADYNRDGKCSISDIIQMLLDYKNGKCP
jgi:hypothetical protein